MQPYISGNSASTPGPRRRTPRRPAILLGGLLLIILLATGLWAALAGVPVALPRLGATPGTSTRASTAQPRGSGAHLAAPTQSLQIQTKLIYVDDPLAPQPPPRSADPDTRYYTETGHYLSGPFLDYYRLTPDATALFGLPLSEEFAQQLAGGATYRVQYFERARFEWHPEQPAGRQVGLGLLVPAILQGRTFDRLSPLPSTRSRVYFPETGHTLAYGFLSFWQSNGGLGTFGFPLSEEMAEGALTVQYFERARFEYHKDLAGTPYAVQLSPTGYLALQAGHFNLPAGSLVRFDPPVLAEGHTTVVDVGASTGMTVTGEYEGRALRFKADPQDGISWALLGAVPFQDLGFHQVTVIVESSNGERRTVSRMLDITPYPFPSESLQFDPQTASLLDPAITGKETDILNAIFAGRTPDQYWQGTFRMPLDGPIRITSYFATRRCYSCPPGGTPTSYHGGLDMAADLGTPVHAPADGRIVFAGRLQVRGNAVIIDHGMGVYTLLAHNSELIANVGQFVHKGDVVSLSGSTGLSNGPHVHWELHVSGPGVDPLEWVKRAMP